MSKCIGFDIGNKYVRTVICGDEPIFTEEPAAVAVDTVKQKVVACCNDAVALAGRVPGSVDIRFPFNGNEVPDPAYIYSLMSYLIRKNKARGADIFISLPGSHDIGRENLYLDNIRHTNAVVFIDSTLAARYGCDTGDALNSLVADIGASTADIAVYRNGELVRSGSYTCAGNEIDKAISAFLYKTRSVRITPPEVERIKREIGTLSPSGEKTVGFSCLHNTVGLPEKLSVSESEVSAAIEPVFDDIADAFTDILHGTAYKPDKIILTGGSASLGGLASSLAPLVCLPVETAPEPGHAVIRGIFRIISENIE